MKSILNNINILNGLLSAAVLVLACLTVIPFLNPDIHIRVPQVTKTIIPIGTQTIVPASTSPVDYALISEQNLFHPERKIPPEKAEEKAIPRPEIVLYGTLLTSDVSIAYIEDKKAPKTTPGRGKRQIAVQKGHNINGYILQQIEPDRIVFVKGDDRILVRLEDGEKRRDTEMTKAPGTVGMLPASLQPPASSAPSQSPKAAPAASSLVPAVPLPGTGGIGVPGSRAHSRQGMLQEVQQMKLDRLKQTQ
jgi:hypothetical protein